MSNEANSTHAQEVENIAESCGIWPRHDDIQRRFLDGADMRQSLQEFASKLREKDAATIAQQKEEITELWEHLRDAQNGELEALKELFALQEQVKMLVEARNRVVELERTNAMLTDLRYELMGIAADVDSGNGFDSVCRNTLQRIIDKLTVPTGSEEWLQQQINEALGNPPPQ